MVLPVWSGVIIKTMRCLKFAILRPPQHLINTVNFQSILCLHTTKFDLCIHLTFPPPFCSWHNFNLFHLQFKESMLAVAPDPVCALLKFPCSTYYLVIVLPCRSTNPNFSWSQALLPTRCSCCLLLSPQPPNHGPAALLVQPQLASSQACVPWHQPTSLKSFNHVSLTFNLISYPQR